MDEATYDELRSLEEAMWSEETRYDRDWMRRHLTEDFLEYGQSGRTYDLEAALVPTSGAIDVVLPLPDFAVSELGTGMALVTYRSIRRIEGETLVANRASLWVQSEQGWRMRFHQGTPVPDDLVD